MASQLHRLFRGLSDFEELSFSCERRYEDIDHRCQFTVSIIKEMPTFSIEEREKGSSLIGTTRFFVHTSSTSDKFQTSLFPIGNAGEMIVNERNMNQQKKVSRRGIWS